MKRPVNIVAVLALLLFLGCTLQRTPAVEVPAAEPKSIGEPVKPAWQQEWEKTLAAARREGNILVSSSAGPHQNEALREGLMRAYGLNIEFVVGTGAQRLQKLFSERRAGLYLVDIYLTAPNSFINELKPGGVLDPIKPRLVLPEVLDPNTWYGGKQIYVDSEGTHIVAMSYFPYADILVNTDLVRPNEIGTNKDLLSPKWKGKIVMTDPTGSGSGQRWFQMVSRSLGYDFMRDFVKQEPQLSRDYRQQVEWVARGKYAVHVGVYAASVGEFMDAGAPIKYVQATDVMYAGAGNPMGLVNRAPHPNAAKVFINWLLTKEGQSIYSKAYLMQSARVDVPTDYLPPEMVRRSGAAYLSMDAEEVLLERPSVQKEAEKIFGPLKK
ncbi:MAG: extracellular solute-binding protein [Chloroflexi bacterium]|nr:extracellular solute-binding protein [Chloroflexota bacterium]